MTIANGMFDKEKEEKNIVQKDTVMVSGGFDPVHVGHIRLILEAAKFGDVIIIANSDKWLYKKKGFIFMTFAQRKEILDAIKGVILVDSVNDKDGTVCEAIRTHKPTYFANGGDRHRTNTPEVTLCQELGVEMLWGIGGDKKSESSSELVKKVRAFKDEGPLIVNQHSDR
jgi:cytidyltransferase-like protein